jgi:predicted dehydrogenase
MTTAIARPEKLNFAIIGAGRMGLRHVEAARAVGMNLVGVVDSSEASLETARSQQGVTRAQCFADVGEMLAATRPDAVVVATTAPTHAPFVIQCARAGVKQILCEKPMAISLTEARAMVEACRAGGAQLAVNHQMRFMPQYTRVKALIGSEALGPLARIVVAGSNFGLAMNASHYFEMFRYMTDGQIRAVQAWFDPVLLPNPRGPQFEDRSGGLIVRGASNVDMYVDLSANAGHGINVIYICRFGQIVVDELGGWMRVIARQNEFRELPTTRYGMPADVREEEIEPATVVGPTIEVWSAMLTDKPFPDHEAGLHALTALVAAHVSHESGSREVSLDEPSLPFDRQFKWA